jgi:hypothetical protein
MSVATTFPQGLRPLQVVGALDILEKKRILLADQPGAGKTAQALFALEMDGIFDRQSVTLILCNVTGCQLTWSPEIVKRVASQHDIVFADLTNPGIDRYGRMKSTMPSVSKRDDALADAVLRAEDAGLPLVIVANFDLVNWKATGPAAQQGPKMTTLFSLDFDAVLIDESHLVLPTKKDHPRETTQFWAGLQQLKIKRGAFRVSMSGTPDRGKLENRYGHWKFLVPPAHRDYNVWLKEEFQVSYEKIGYYQQNHRDRVALAVGSLKNAERWRLVDEMRMIRRTKAEMLAGLPPKQWADDGATEVHMTARQAQAYADYQADMDAKYEELISSEDLKEQNRAQALKLQFALRARQMSICTWEFSTTEGTDGKEHTHGEPLLLGREGSGKLAWLLDEYLAPRGYLEQDLAGATPEKVVIASFFTQSLDWLQKELASEGVKSEVLSGDTPAPEKKRIEAAFQTGDLRVILLSGYVGVSINLDAADDLIFLDSVHDPDKMEQTEDRIHRASRDHVCTYFRLTSKDTIDEAIVEVIDARYKATRATYDGNRAVEFARKMLSTKATRATERELEVA